MKTMKNPKLSTKARMRKDLDGYILYYSAGHVTLMLNSIAYYILTLCNGENSCDDIIDLISEDYNTDAETIRQDVLNLLEKLRRIKIVDDFSESKHVYDMQTQLSNFHKEITTEFETNILEKKFVVCPGVFSPIRTLTSEFLARHLVTKHGDTVLDLGTGIGIQAIIASEKAKKVIATDINPYAISCAKKNIQLNDLEGRIELREGDLFQPVQHEQFDLIVWNPPYLPLKPRSILEMSWCCGKDFSLIEKFLNEARKHLASSGRIEIVFSAMGNIPRLIDKAKSNSFSVSIVSSTANKGEEMRVLLLTCCI